MSCGNAIRQLQEDLPVRWHDAAAADTVSEDQPVAVDVAGYRIALFKVEGEYFATQDVCPHAEASLAEGYVEDGVVECPLHQAGFDIRTGKVLSAPANCDLTTYPVRAEGGRLLVGVPSA